MNNKRENQYRQLGLMIAYYRKLKGLTQMQLAELVGVSRTHISNLEAPNMDKSISLDRLFDISDALNVPIKNFLISENNRMSDLFYSLSIRLFFCHGLIIFAALLRVSTISYIFVTSPTASASVR